jgi:hypothetical protein
MEGGYFIGSTSNIQQPIHLYAPQSKPMVSGRTAPERSASDSIVTDARAPSRNSTWAWGSGCASPPLMRIRQSSCACIFVIAPFYGNYFTIASAGFDSAKAANDACIHEEKRRAA